MVKVALIGAGGIGEAHSSAYSLLQSAKVTAVLDVRPERASLIAEKHGAHVYTTLEALFANEAPDMVDICTPTFTHKELAIESLKRGFHVLCEKPIAISMEDAEAMVAMAQQRRRKFMIAQVIRFWPEYVYLKQAFEKSTFGQLIHASFYRNSGAPLWAWDGWYVDPQRSGQAPYEMGIHDIDFIQYLLGKPDQISAVGNERADIHYSFLHTRMRYLTGLRVDAEAAWYNGPVPFSATYRAIFERGVLDYNGSQLMLYRTGASEGEKVDVAQKVSFASAINLPDAGPIYNEIAYFVDCVEKDVFPSVIKPKDSLESLHILLRALESAREGRIISPV